MNSSKPTALLASLLASLFTAGLATAADSTIIPFNLTQNARVSLGVYNKEGAQVRTLLIGEALAKGTHSVVWDGLDLDGKPAPAGEYTWRLLQSPGLEAEWLMNLGTSTGIEHWPSQHGGPSCALVDGNAIIVGGITEGSPLLAKLDFDGHMRWQLGQKKAPEGAADLALDDGRLFVLEDSSRIDVIDPATSKDIKVQGDWRNVAYQLWLPARRLDPIPENKDQDKDDQHRARTVEMKLDGLRDGKYLIRVKARLGVKGGNLSCAIRGSGDAKWFNFEGLQTGQSKEVVAPLAYGNQECFEIAGGRLTFTVLFKDGDPEASWAIDELELLAPCERIDAHDGALVGVFPGAESLAWIDPANGKILSQKRVPGIRDASLLSAGEAIAACGDELRRVLREGETTTLVKGLEGAIRIAVDRPAGGAFVLTGQKGQPWEPGQRIASYGKDWKLRATFGRAGGRAMGRYKPEDFAGVNDLASDGKGGFTVAEWWAPPRRVAHFDGAGKLLKEWYGGQQFYSFASPDPKEPNRVLMDSQWGSLMDLDVDYQKRTWSVRACYAWGGDVDERLISRFKMATRHHVLRWDLDGDGKTERLVWLEGGQGTLFRIDEEAGLLRPLALAGEVSIDRGYPNWKPLEDLPTAWLEAIRKLGKDPASLNERIPRTGFTWADPTGKGMVTAESMRLVEVGGHGFGGPDGPKPAGGVNLIDSDLNVWFGAGWSGKDRPVATCMKVQGYTRAGAPIWDWGVKREAFPATNVFNNTVALTRDATGNLYQLARDGGDNYAIGGVDSWNGHGGNWPSTQCAATAVQKWSPAGKLLWRVGQHASSFNALPGRLQHPVCFTGFVKGCIGVADKVVNPCAVWTEDGLYVGSVLDRHVADGLPERLYTWWRADVSKGDRFDNLSAHQYDMILGGCLFELKDGSVIWFGAGWNNVPVYRITGWDELKRSEGKLSLATPAAASAGRGTGLKAEYFAKARCEGEPALKRTDARLWFGGRGLSNPERVWETIEMRWPEDTAVKGAASVRWTGLVEARFSEEYTLSVYARGKAQVWLGGRLIIDNGRLNGDDEAIKQAAAGNRWKEFSKPVALQAGRKLPLRVEWEGSTQGGGELHVNWESASQPIQHLPQECLYPE